MAVLAVAFCGGDEPVVGPTPAPNAPVRVLLVTATAGFRHDSIPAARAMMDRLAQRRAIAVRHTEDLSSITTETLRSYDVVFFALTSGELPLTTDQRSALISFVTAGGGFVGAHSATDTLYTWPEYGE